MYFWIYSFFLSLVMGSVSYADDIINAPSINATVHYQSKVLTSDGVTKESNYDEHFLRVKNHVWTNRILPPTETNEEQHEGHKHFNHIVTPRHIYSVDNKITVEFVDDHEKELIFIPQSEYENVSFDGKWNSTYFLVDLDLLKKMPVSKNKSSISTATLYEQFNDVIFQRVLWDNKNQIPLMVEVGNKNGSFYQKMTVGLSNKLPNKLPWENISDYAKKEYSDFLD
jgi:hypothetical protein